MENIVIGRTPSTVRAQCLTATLVALVAGAAVPRMASAVEITGYSATVDDRFTGGFPASPTPNTDPSFVGAAYDWSGVGWSAADTTKGFGFITPQHYLVAKHYGGATTITLRGGDGSLRTATQASVTNTGYGVVLAGGPDLSVGRLTAAMPKGWQIGRYAVLDLNAASASNSSYNGQPLLVYGRGPNGTSSPRIGAATINGTVLSGSNSYVNSSLTGSTSVQLQLGDSGSPIFIPWTNPGGSAELTILGNNVGYDSTDNFYNYLANSTVMSAINGLITPDGFALRVQGPTTATWVGSSSTNISARQAWGIAAPGSAPSDDYVLFNGTTASSRAVTVDTNRNLRGLYFKSTASGTLGFTFSGAGTLTLGRGGLTNYDASRQTISSTLALGDHQYWDVGSGGVTAGAITTNGKLLEIAGSGTARITGAVSGTGGIALSGQRLELTGSSSYSGGTWVHAGVLVVNGAIAASSGVTLDAGAALAGSGRVGAISGSGVVEPGNSPGILTATSVNPAGGLDFGFEFTQTGAPIWASGTASGNDVLRLTDPTSPFTASLGASSAIDVYLGVTALARNDTFQGGFFTDASSSFLALIHDASFNYYVLGDGLGTAKTYNGQGYYLLDTSFWPSFEAVVVSTVNVASANFIGGTVTNGQVMQLIMVPEPGALGVAAMGVVMIAVAWRRTRAASARSGGPEASAITPTA